MDLLSLTLSLVRRNPYPLFSFMRRYQPVFSVQKYKLWLVFNYEDTRRVLTEQASFSSDFRHLEGAEAMQNPQMRSSLITSDPPVHTKLRALVTRAFTARAVANLEPRIASLTHSMLDQVIETGRMDLVDDLAYPLPVVVISEMLGIPSEDRAQFRIWSDQLVRSANTLFGDRKGMQADVPEGSSPLVMEGMEPYLAGIIEQRRREPREDLISGLVAAELDGERLTAADLMSFCSLLLVAGNITTTNLVANAMLSFVQHPAALARLQADPALLAGAIDEVLRYQSPVQFTFRITTRAVELSGKTIPAGSVVLAFIGSANRDSAKFPNPGRFDITRDPNPHIAFGYGIHYCLGAPLARLEGRIVLSILLQRMRDIRLANLLPLTSGDALILHGVRHLPLRFRPAARASSPGRTLNPARS
ncbi:MAG: cytochrome P450, partial [Anaerolineales bacterium]